MYHRGKITSQWMVNGCSSLPRVLRHLAVDLQVNRQSPTFEINFKFKDSGKKKVRAKIIVIEFLSKYNLV